MWPSRSNDLMGCKFWKCSGWPVDEGWKWPDLTMVRASRTKDDVVATGNCILSTTTRGPDAWKTS